MSVPVERGAVVHLVAAARHDLEHVEASLERRGRANGIP